MTNQPVKSVDPEVDFVNLAKTIWQRKMLVVKLTLIAAVAGFLVSLLIPNRYTASTMLVQVLSDPTITLNEEKLAAMSSLAAIAGVDLSGLTKAKMSPRTFSDIISSIPFRQDLMRTTLNFGKTDTATTLYDFYTKTGPEQPPVTSTISLPGRMTNPVKAGNDNQNIPQLTREEIQINKILDKQVSVQVIEDEYINISCTLPEAVAAAQLTRRTAELLQIYLTEIQTEKPRASLRFIQERFDEAKRNFLRIHADPATTHTGNYVLGNEATSNASPGNRAASHSRIAAAGSNTAGHHTAGNDTAGNKATAYESPGNQAASHTINTAADNAASSNQASTSQASTNTTYRKAAADRQAVNNQATSNEAVNLPTDYRLAEKLYLDLASKLELTKIAINEQTPVFKIINPVTVPSEKSSPNRIKITIISAFFGFVMAMALILGKDFIEETKEKWRKNGQ